MPRYPKWAVDDTTKFIDDWCATNKRRIIPGERRRLIRLVLDIWPSGVESEIHRWTIADTRNAGGTHAAAGENK